MSNHTRTLEIYLSSVPCPCMGGRGQDEAATRLQEDVLELKARHPGLVVLTHGLNTNIAAFRARPGLSELLRTLGTDALPAVYVDGKGEPALTGRHPTLDELEALLATASVEGA